MGNAATIQMINHLEQQKEDAMLQKIQKKTTFNYFLRIYNSNFIHELGDEKTLYDKWVCFYQPHINKLKFK